MAIRVGDFVTCCFSGYWQLIGIKPRFATEDRNDEYGKYKKGDMIGQFAILKKAFTPKMKMRIEFEYCEASYIRAVSDDVLKSINDFFTENPEFKNKFDNAKGDLRPMLTNCWFNLPLEKELDFQNLIDSLPAFYTLDEFWKIAKKYKKYAKSTPPSQYVINFSTYPWNMNKKFDFVYFKAELIKNEHYRKDN